MFVLLERKKKKQKADGGPGAPESAGSGTRREVSEAQRLRKRQGSIAKEGSPSERLGTHQQRTRASYFQRSVIKTVLGLFEGLGNQLYYVVYMSVKFTHTIYI